MRRLLRPLWIILALLFLLEAWLWDHLEPIVAWVVDLVPWDNFKQALRRGIERLPAWAALGLFIIPVLVLLPLKFLEVYFLATANWVGAVIVLIGAKLIGLGVTAFVFDAARDKLLQLVWFHRMYDWLIWARDWAHAQTDPIRREIRRIVFLLRPQRSRRAFRRLMRLRRRAYYRRAA